VKAAQKRGVKFGRKSKMTPDRLAHARKIINQGTTPTDAAKIIGIGRATFTARCSARRLNMLQPIGSVIDYGCITTELIGGPNI